MLKDNRPTRRFFAVKGEIGEAFAQMAMKRNLTLYSFVSDLLEKVVELDRAGVSLDQTYKTFLIQKTAKEIGLVQVPENLWYETFEGLSKTDRRRATQLFSDAGEWIGKYCLANNDGEDLARALGSCLASLAGDANDFSLDGGETIRLRCVNPKFSQEYAEAFSILLSKAFEMIGYECGRRTVSRGMIFLVLHIAPKLERTMRSEILA